MKILYIVIALYFLQGCSFVVPSYQVADANKTEIAKYDRDVFAVNATSDDQKHKSIACRAVGSVELSDGGSFSDYIFNALVDELKSSGKLSEDGTKLVVRIEKVNFSSAMGATNWYIDAKYEIDGSVISVSTVYNDSKPGSDHNGT